MNIPTAIFLVICALFLGIALGGFIASVRQDKKSKQETADTQPSDLIRLGKDPESGALQVIIAGQVFHTAAEMSSMQRALAGYAASDLRAWLIPQSAAVQSAETETSKDAGGSAPIAAPAPESAIFPVSPPEAPLPSSQERGAEAEPETEGDPKKGKKGGFVSMITRALGTDASSTRLVTKSIAVQVNEILQEKLKGSHLEDRGVCLMELPGQEMVVMIGLEKYNSVSVVPDDEVRTVLQSAVNEWLARSSKR